MSSVASFWTSAGSFSIRDIPLSIAALATAAATAGATRVSKESGMT